MSRHFVLIWWLVLSSLGVTLVALPDAGPRLVTFSQAHGPGLVDSIGITLLLLGNAFVYGYVWRRRAALKPFNPWWAFAAGIGAGLLLASILSDFTAWWAIGATILFGLQVVLFAHARPAVT